ncbi:response regulator transcription factor [Niastella caeni]|uniref:Response regulator transcription factor n=1 Tax=Niastella caeni TaxID=2569763 RepID=A0A4V4H1H7_9BACT|nr:response regulator transcription factor [Niastella caeni]THU40576.1 response regulator transcription factor [Niastella caeni]
MENAQPVTIAIVDDHAMLRQAMTLRLNLLGYKVVLEAENGRVFLDQLPKLPSPPQICLLDINMPVMDGFEAAIELKKNWPQIRILFFSMHNSKAFICKAQQIGAEGFLPKDASFEELKQALVKVAKL